MTYTVREIFYTLQGEGANAGTPAVFCRFAGCNLWSGREGDRTTALCQWCDTDFVGGTSYKTAGQLALAIRQRFPSTHPFVVLTGGEPMLQVDQSLLNELHALRCYIAIETNGTRQVPVSIDWITVSPKVGTDIVQRSGQELKVVVPQDDFDLAPMLAWDFRHFFVQPKDGDPTATQTAIAWAMTNPRWRVSFQMHKFVDLP